MVARNPITGDTIQTKVASDAYRDGWDRIFGKKDRSFVATVQQEGDELLIEFPEDVLSELGWKPNDILIWEVKDGSIFLRKKEDQNNASVA